MKKILVAYFSASGTTAYTAKEIAKTVGADLYDFSGKTLIPFATSGGSGIGKAEKSLREHCSKANWKRGKLVNSGAAAWSKSVLGE